MAKRTTQSSSMRSQMALGDFFVAYLARAGVSHLFGLPGDLVLGLFHRFGRERDLEIVTFSHEPTVGFAADGYARSTRRLGVVCVTYGAGGHNIVNATGGAYAEQIPLLVVSGGPGVAEQQLAGVHHQVKDIDSQRRVFREVTCDARVIGDLHRAASDIHEVVQNIMAEGRPGYIEIHRDLTDALIPVPKEIMDWDGSYPRPPSDRRKLGEAVSDTVTRLKTATKPILIGGVELFREGAERAFVRLAEKIGAPVVTTPLAKGVFPMDHPLHMGIHIGPFSPAPIQKRVQEADLVLALGTQLTDMNLGASRPQVKRDLAVWATSGRVNISYHTYTEVTLRDFVERLGKEKLKDRNERVVYHDNLKRGPKRKASSPLRINELLLELNHFLEERPGYHVVAESGDSLFGGLELRVRGKGLYMAQGYYASMGFGVPAALGAEIGTGRRPLLLTGDGAFQMTGPEISHAPRYGLSPIVVLINNVGWQIFRPVSPRPELLDVPNWPYADLAEAWGGVGMQARNAGELRDALDKAHRSKRFVIIECHTSPDDLSPISRRYIKESARKARTGASGSAKGKG